MRAAGVASLGGVLLPCTASQGFPSAHCGLASVCRPCLGQMGAWGWAHHVSWLSLCAGGAGQSGGTGEEGTAPELSPARRALG